MKWYEQLNSSSKGFLAVQTRVWDSSIPTPATTWQTDWLQHLLLFDTQTVILETCDQLTKLSQHDHGHDSDHDPDHDHVIATCVVLQNYVLEQAYRLNCN